MILRLKGVITHVHDIKLSGEDREGVLVGWGTRPSPKVKPFEEDPGDTSTHRRGNRPNLGKDSTLVIIGGTNPTPRRSPTSVNVGGEEDQERCIPISRLTGIRPETVGIR